MRRQPSRQRLHVHRAHLRRQRNQRRPIIQPHAVADILRTQRKEITTPQFHVTTAPNFEVPALLHLGFKPVLAEEILYRPPRQLHTQHSVALPGQPDQIQAFAAQRHQHSATRLKAQCRPVRLQVRIDLPLMKADLVIGPPLVPESWLHGCSLFIE